MEDLRVLLESRLSLSSNLLVWVATAAISITLILTQIKVPLNPGDPLQLVVYLNYGVIPNIAVRNSIYEYKESRKTKKGDN